MKTITDKQIACINKCKSVIDDKENGNALDRIDITQPHRHHPANVF